MAVRPSFFAELKRRNVVRAAVLYAGAVWALSQGISQLSPAFDLPTNATRWFVIACAIGFPFWVAFAWFYEFTPSGLKRESEIDTADSIAHHTGRKLNYWIFGVMAVAIVLLLTNTFVWHKGAWLNTGSDAARTVSAKSIAVLPFENLSNDKNNAYFVAGMQDLILTKLADVGDLKVISRTSTIQYASHPENLTEVGQQLGVATILEGSVQKAGNQVLVNVQLIDARTDNHIWAQAYTRTLDNIFGVEGDVAGKVAAALDAKLSLAENAQLAAVPTTNRDAYDLFLRAEYLVNQGLVNADAARWKAALPLYRQAVNEDPKFALAFARLSIAESRLAFNSDGEGVAQLKAQARNDADVALRLQPGLAMAQLARGYCDYWGRRDYPSALKAFAAVLQRRPNDAEALAAQGYVQRREGHIDDAIASLTRAVALDPRNFTPTYELGNTYMMVSRYAEAEQWLKRALALEQDSINAKTGYSNAILYGSGDIPRALAAVQGDDPALKFQRVALLVYQRRFPDGIALLESIPDTPDNFPPGFSKNYALACVYLQVGDLDRANHLFAQALPGIKAALEGAQGLAAADLWENLGMDEVGSNQGADGLAALARSEAILNRSHDVLLIPSYKEFDASVFSRASRPDLAVPLLAHALAMPGVGLNYSPVLLWLDPVWDPIRHDPGFQALLKKYAKYKPAVIYPIPPAPASSAPRPRQRPPDSSRRMRSTVPDV